MKVEYRDRQGRLLSGHVTHQQPSDKSTTVPQYESTTVTLPSCHRLGDEACLDPANREYRCRKPKEANALPRHIRPLTTP